MSDIKNEKPENKIIANAGQILFPSNGLLDMFSFLTFSITAQHQTTPITENKNDNP